MSVSDSFKSSKLWKTLTMKGSHQADIGMAMAIMMVLAVLFFPVPPLLLDILLAASIGMAVLVIIYSMSITDALELSSFPSILLLLTLFRLSMNVATTRQILLTGFAGNLIEAFGNFVVGGNYIVGIVVFLILVIINFKVITKGSGRIAEVTARFTLDALPGKQMSIDADLNQGLIDEQTAVKRRDKLRQEADFYGAMDGASKFVAGDAVAGLIITAINICAGFAVGMLNQNMTAAESITRYTILTIGDGLVSQIPALIISTAAGVIVTRAASTDGLGTQLSQQLFMKPRQMMIAGAIMCGIAIVPGMPILPFVSLGGSLAGLGFFLKRKGVTGKPEDLALEAGKKAAGALPPGAKVDPAPEQAGPKKSMAPGTDYKSVLAVSPMDLEIGFGLIPLVDKSQGGRLIERISSVRMQIAEEMGIILPPVNVRDNVDLRNTEYLIRIRGLEITRGHVHPGMLLAIDPSGELPMEGGRPVKEPAFGFVAYWIPESKREHIESRGFTVVDCASVTTTHLAAVVKRNAADILTRQDVSNMIDAVKESNPAVVQELIPNKMNVGAIHRVLQGLLKERVTIRDMAIILETLADNVGKTQDPTFLIEMCRRTLGGHISRTYLMPDGMLKALGLHPALEDMLRQYVRKDGSSAFGPIIMDPALAQNMLKIVHEQVQTAKANGIEPVLVCSPSIRPQFRQLIQHDLPDTAVLSFAEIPDTVPVEMVSLVQLPETQQQASA